MNKYGNIKVTRIVNGEKVTFDSKKEGRRYDQLLLLLKARKITELKLQPKFLLIDTLRLDGHKTMPKKHYIADFQYKQDGIEIVEDVKGMKTAIYQIKKHLLLAKYGHLYKFIEIF